MSDAPPHPKPTAHKRVIVLGSTGSVGVQTLTVIEHLNALAQRGGHATRYELVGLAAGSNHEALFAQARRLGVRDLALRTPPPVGADQSGLRLRAGDDAAKRLIDDVPCELVVGAVVGIAGLGAVLRAIESGADVALANKETLVAAGALVTEAAFASGARLLPLDSEHAGVWQCLAALDAHHPCPPMHSPDCVSRVVLTASGGAFLGRTRQQVHDARVEDALNHPNWDMGAKVTIDTATLMNKALELIEAHWLFGLPAERLGAVIHPQSIVHALIECADGSVIAQLGAPDMRAPIQHALCDGRRPPGCAPRLDVAKMGRLDFIEIDHERYPAIALAMRAIEAGGDAGAALNAANEQAVRAYRRHELPFGRIDECVASVMDAWSPSPVTTQAGVLAADAHARERADRLIAAHRVGGPSPAQAGGR